MSINQKRRSLGFTNVYTRFTDLFPNIDTLYNAYVGDVLTWLVRFYKNIAQSNNPRS